MKTIAIGSILAIFAVMVVAPAFADHASVDVSIPAGAATPGCEETNECYIESEVTIDVGSEVIWSNDDSASQTVTSGDPKNGPDGNFDSNLFLAGQTFSHMFEEEGEFPYFCLVHPWMQGIVIVQEVPRTRSSSMTRRRDSIDSGPQAPQTQTTALIFGEIRMIGIHLIG